ncbi:uncharacterized protein LOC144924922 isoform X3 [Branchiostoma floridae x Branchiostoma belcheri]
MRQKGVPARLDQDGSNKAGQVEGAQGDSQASWCEAPEMVAMPTEAASSHASTDGEESSRPETMGDIGWCQAQFVCEYCQSLHESPSLLQAHVQKKHTAVVPTEAFRRERNRIRMQEKRKNLTEEERAKIREKQKLQARQRRKCMSAEKKAEEREKDRLTKQMMRKCASDDELVDLREKNRVQKMMYRQNASEEQRAVWRKRDKLRKREDREVKAVQYQLFDKLYSSIEALLVGMPPDSDQNCSTDQGPIQNTEQQASTEESKTCTASDAVKSVQNMLTFMRGANLVTDSEITRIHDIIWKTMNNSSGDLINDVIVYQNAVENCRSEGDLQETTDGASSSQCTEPGHQPGSSSPENAHLTEEKSEKLGIKSTEEHSPKVDFSSDVIVKQEVDDCADNFRASDGGQHLPDSPKVAQPLEPTYAEHQPCTPSREAAALAEVVQKVTWLRALVEGQDCPEIHLAIKRERMKIRNMLRMLIAPTQDMEKEREIAKIRMALKRQAATPDARELEKEKGRMRMRWKRMRQTEEEREREKEKNRVRTRLKRMEMSAEERERIKERERLRKRMKREMASEEQKQAWRESDRNSKRIKRATSQQQQVGKQWMEGEPGMATHAEEEYRENLSDQRVICQEECEEYREDSASSSSEDSSHISNISIGTNDESSSESADQNLTHKSEYQTGNKTSEEDSDKELEEEDRGKDVGNILADVKQDTASMSDHVSPACTSQKSVDEVETSFYDSNKLVSSDNQPVEIPDHNVDPHDSSAWDPLWDSFVPFTALSND